MFCVAALACDASHMQPLTVLAACTGVKRLRHNCCRTVTLGGPAVHSLPMDVGQDRGKSVAGRDLDRVAHVAARLERELSKAIIGQQRVIREILIAFLAGGHCLLRGVPGLAKTLLIKKLARIFRNHRVAWLRTRCGRRGGWSYSPARFALNGRCAGAAG